MVAIKQEAQEIIQYHLYVVEKIKNGTSRAENGEVTSHQDEKAEILQN